MSANGSVLHESTDYVFRLRAPRVNVLGVALDAISFDDAMETIDWFVDAGLACCVCVCSLQDVVNANGDPDFRRIVNQADLLTADGWPVVWHLRSKGYEQKGRVTGPDLMWAICRDGVSKGRKHFLYGGAEEVPGLLSENLESSFPGIEIVGAYSPPYRELTDQEEDEIVSMINASGADYVWIGLSTPKQHYWMDRFRSRLMAPVMLTVGAAFDFHSNRVSRAPKWMQDFGLEWLHRAASEPRRLGMRYLRFIPKYVYLHLAETLRCKRFDIDDCKNHYGPSE